MLEFKEKMNNKKKYSSEKKNKIVERFNDNDKENKSVCSKNHSIFSKTKKRENKKRKKYEVV